MSDTDTILEIKARKDVIRRIAYPISQLEKAEKKERAKREERIASLCEFENVDDAQEAYGYGEISVEEYDEVRDILEKGEEYVDNTVTATAIALDILRDFNRRMKRDIESLEWDMLSFEEQERIRKSNEELKARVNARRVGG